MAPYIEYLDARNALTAAETRHIVNTWDYLIYTAELEKVTANYDFEN